MRLRYPSDMLSSRGRRPHACRGRWKTCASVATVHPQRHVFQGVSEQRVRPAPMNAAVSAACRGRGPVDLRRHPYHRQPLRVENSGENSARQHLRGRSRTARDLRAPEPRAISWSSIPGASHVCSASVTRSRTAPCTSRTPPRSSRPSRSKRKPACGCPGKRIASPPPSTARAASPRRWPTRLRLGSVALDAGDHGAARSADVAPGDTLRSIGPQGDNTPVGAGGAGTLSRAAASPVSSPIGRRCARTVRFDAVRITPSLVSPRPAVVAPRAVPHDPVLTADRRARESTILAAASVVHKRGEIIVLEYDARIVSRGCCRATRTRPTPSRSV